MKRLPKLVKIVISTTVFLLLLQVLAANRLTTTGLTLTKMVDQEEKLQEENELLERKIATFSSLTQIAQKAAEAGFINHQALYLTPELPVALEHSNVNAPR